MGCKEPPSSNLGARSHLRAWTTVTGQRATLVPDPDAVAARFGILAAESAEQTAEAREADNELKAGRDKSYARPRFARLHRDGAVTARRV